MNPTGSRRYPKIDESIDRGGDMFQSKVRTSRGLTLIDRGSRRRGTLAPWITAMLVLLAGSPAVAVVLDFESWAHADDQEVLQSTTYNQDDYRIFLSAAPPEAWRTYGSLHPSFAGSTAIYATNTTYTAHVYRPDGQLFDFRSVDVVRGRFTNFASGSILFYGRFQEWTAPQVTHRCFFDGAATTFVTCDLPPEFTQLREIFFYTGFPHVALDNFDVELSPVPQVPSIGPAAGLLLLGALVAVGKGRRRN